MRIPSLKEYVLIAQDEARVEVFRRPTGGGHWTRDVATAGQTITLHERTIAVDEIYGK